tara:strand:- start:50 stop:376 length:327 start_codon:yes stop_codon:yes gene_type:complete
MSNKYQSFREFYPFYLSEHMNPICRIFHFIGTALVIVLIISAFFNVKTLLFIPLCGYGFAWAGHFFFEKNKPATFIYPIYSLIGDCVMFKDILIGRESLINPKIQELK